MVVFRSFILVIPFVSSALALAQNDFLNNIHEIIARAPDPQECLKTCTAIPTDGCDTNCRCTPWMQSQVQACVNCMPEVDTGLFDGARVIAEQWNTRCKGIQTQTLTVPAGATSGTATSTTNKAFATQITTSGNATSTLFGSGNFTTITGNVTVQTSVATQSSMRNATTLSTIPITTHTLTSITPTETITSTSSIAGTTSATTTTSTTPVANRTPPASTGSASSILESAKTHFVRAFGLAALSAGICMAL